MTHGPTRHPRPLGPNGGTVQVLADVSTSLTDEQWHEFGVLADHAMDRKGWRVVTHAKANGKAPALGQRGSSQMRVWIGS